MSEDTCRGQKSCSICCKARSWKHIYCYRCGNKLDIRCIKCSKELPQEYPFCPYTGTSLEHD